MCEAVFLFYRLFPHRKFGKLCAKVLLKINNNQTTAFSGFYPQNFLVCLTAEGCCYVFDIKAISTEVSRDCTFSRTSI